jgi:hypothetical protein
LGEGCCAKAMVGTTIAAAVVHHCSDAITVRADRLIAAK